MKPNIDWNNKAEVLEAVPQYLLFEAYLSEVASLKDVHKKYYSGMS